MLDEVFPILSRTEMMAALEPDVTEWSLDWDILAKAQRALSLRQVVKHIRENRLFEDMRGPGIAGLLESLLTRTEATPERLAAAEAAQCVLRSLLAALEEDATLLEDWAQLLTKEYPHLNVGTLLGSAKRSRAAIAKATGPQAP